MKTSNLHLRIRILRAKPYQPRNTPAFTTMRAAEQKRRDRAARNLALVRKGGLNLSTASPHLHVLVGPDGKPL